ncbi:Os06g0107600, partial [Oryza sativa Japonica Group]
HGVVARRWPAGHRHAGSQRRRGGVGVARQGRHGRRPQPSRPRHSSAAHGRHLPRPNCLLQREEVQAKAHTGDLHLSLRQCCARGSSKAVHDLRCFEIHHGDLRHCLLQYRSCPHILACHPNTVRITEPEEKDRHCKACGHADISSRSHGADILQGRGCHPHNQDPPCNSSSSSSSRSSHEQQELDAGHGGHPGQLRVPLLLVPPPQQARQEVPPCLLLQCLHVHVQLPPGGRRRPLHTTQRLRLDRQDQVPHTHHPLRRCGGVWPFVCATDMVHREARSSVRRSLHSGGADHCFSD